MSKMVYFTWCFVLFARSSVGQGFEFKVNIDTITANQFYKVLLPPAILSRLNDNFSDIRLYDGQGKEVPYVLKREQAVQHKTLFKEYKIISRTI
jgi:uncharacterized membrane protein